jgi:ABC-type transport system involved in cytochrome bd biosynthesis fused ATPase/permease subunit
MATATEEPVEVNPVKVVEGAMDKVEHMAAQPPSVFANATMIYSVIIVVAGLGMSIWLNEKRADKQDAITQSMWDKIQAERENDRDQRSKEAKETMTRHHEFMSQLSLLKENQSKELQAVRDVVLQLATEMRIANRRQGFGTQVPEFESIPAPKAKSGPG